MVDEQTTANALQAPGAQLRKWRKQTDTRRVALAAQIGVTAGAVKAWERGIVFPRDEQCDALFKITSLACFGSDRAAARDRAVPKAVKDKRKHEYLAHADEKRKRARGWYATKNKTHRQSSAGWVPRERVPEAELKELRADPRRRKEVCRECGEDYRSGEVAQHIWAEHKMRIAAYKEKWGFCRTGNASRSERAQENQRTAMKGHRPPKWTAKLLPKAIESSKQTNQPGTARLEERLNARDRRRGGKQFHARPDQQKHATDARIVGLHLRGKSLKEIWASTGSSISATSLRLKRMGYDGRNHAYLHGEEIGPQHFLDYRADFGLTVPQAAADVRIGLDWAYARMNSKHAENAFTFDLGSRLIKAREKRTASFRLRPATKKGGRPNTLPQSERISLHDKYPLLLKELQALHARPRKVRLWTWLCDEFRAERLPLLKRWPAFFEWADKNLFGEWKPNDLARQFLASDYDVSDDTVSNIVFRKSKVA
jgi:hypothetical protein